MITLKLRDQDSVEVRIELDKKHKEFDTILSIVKTIPGRYYDKEHYAWVIPKTSARLLCDQIDPVSRIGFLSRESEIFGEPVKSVLPEFQVKDDFLNELALQLYPYQKVGACFLHDIGKAIIGDDMGLGNILTK